MPNTPVCTTFNGSIISNVGNTLESLSTTTLVRGFIDW